MGFLTFVALVGLTIAVVKLRQQLAEMRRHQVRLSTDLLELQRRQQHLEYDWRQRSDAIRDEGAASMTPGVPAGAPPGEPPGVSGAETPFAPAATRPAQGQPTLGQAAPRQPALPPSVTDAMPGAAARHEHRPGAAAGAPPAGAWLEPAKERSPNLDSLAVASRSMLAFFTTGNVVAKVGIIIVFFGVAFLLRYAAERGLLPIEYRLMATAGGALLLLGIGWRLRHSRREYGVVLQGGAVGLLYLTIFAAYRLYDLLPAPLTFILLLLVVAFSGVLAVVQDAMSLAVLGTSGGFLAPILASTGGGSHVALFSYYAALNIGVLGIAWFRSWRFLNWLAFVFTFGIGFTWGQQFYQPALLGTTEPFLVFFFLLFIAVAVLFAHRQAPQLRGYIDGSLVFGLPAVAFGMQSVLVGEIPFGRAYSAVAMSAIYLTLTRALWRRDQALRPLAESFLALAVVFLILVVPLAFDGHATAAAWALEGAGLVWIGIRQQRRLSRLVGAGLLLGAGAAFAAMTAPAATGLAVLNTRFLACAAIAVGSITAAKLLSDARGRLGALDVALEWILLVWGLLWWFGPVEVEIRAHVWNRYVVASSLIAVAASGCLIAFLARRWRWRAMMLTTIPLGPVTWIWAPLLFLIGDYKSPLANGGWLAWPAVIGTSALLVFWFEQTWPRIVVWIWHVTTSWLFMFLTTWALAFEVHELVPDARTWTFVIWCVIPALWVMATPALPRTRWPARSFPLLYAVIIPAAPVVVMLWWFLIACTEEGAAAPLPYVPGLNPLEVTQALAILVSYAWWKRHASLVMTDAPVRLAGSALLAALAFLGINVIVARTVHFYLNVPFEAGPLVQSSIVQTGISILWGVTAALLMGVARRRLQRPMWMVGVGLLTLLILKLFVIDLENIGTVARIVSFLATGILILLIGYFAPAPPRSASHEEHST